MSMMEVEHALQPDASPEQGVVFSGDDVLSDILICPVTGETLAFHPSPSGGMLRTPSGGQRYGRENGAWDLMPNPMPEALASKAETWRTLQANGAFVYEADPRQNLTTDRIFAEKLQSIMGLQGRVLDIGCGPQKEKPAYLSHVDDDKLVGIDPLPGNSARDFTFIKGIAEALPFLDHAFEHVVFCRTLDHMLDFRAALRSAMRVTRPGGTVQVLMDDTAKSGSSGAGGASRFLHIVRRGAAQIGCAIRHQGLRHALGYAWKASRLQIPEGAMDFFHAYFPERDEVIQELREADAKDVDVLELGQELLITARRCDA